MSSATPVSLAARERLREHQLTSARVLAHHATALKRLEAATSRRTDVLVQLDAHVADAEREVARAVGEAARVMGTEVAAAVLGLRKAEVRRMAAVATT